MTLHDRVNVLDSIVVLQSDEIVVCGKSPPHWWVKSVCPRTSTVLGQYNLPSLPLGLAKSRDQQVVVTLPWKRQILYLDVQGDICCKIKLDTEKGYHFISVLHNHKCCHLAATGLFEESGNCVDILDERGNVIQTIDRESIPNPSRLTVSGERLLVVTDGGQSLTCVTSSDMTWYPFVEWRSRDVAGKGDGLRGVACDMEEFIYICDEKRHCIVQLSRDGQVIDDVITEHDGLSRPRSVYCDEDRLYVGQWNGDIKIFTVNNSPCGLCKERKFNMTKQIKIV